MSNAILDAGVGRHVPVTRRRLIRTGGLAAIAAGLLGTTAPAAAAPLQIPTTLTTVVHTDDLAKECQRLYAEMRAAQSAEGDLGRPIQDAVGYDVMSEYTTASVVHWVTREELLFAELARHLPGLAPTIRMLQSHIDSVAYAAPGACCTVAEGFEV